MTPANLSRYLRYWFGAKLERWGCTICYWSWRLRGMKGWPR